VDDKHDPNGSVPIGTFKATSEDGELEIPIEIVDDDEVDTRQLAIQSSGDDAFIRRHHDSHDSLDSPRRQRVATLLGVPMPGSGVKAIGRATGGDSFDPTKASRGEITAAVDDALDERPTTIYGYKRDSLSELEKIVESEMTEIPSSETTELAEGNELIGVVGDSTDTGTFKIEVLETPRGSMPVLAPAQFVEARARDSKSHDDANNARDVRDVKAEPPTRAVPRPEVTARELTKLEAARQVAKPEHAGDEQPTAAIASRAERTQQEVRRSRVESEPPAPTKPISSLAPMEVKRAARPVAKPREPASAIGYGLVAAMVLLGLGGWFFTAGGYRRSTDPAAPPTAASSVARPVDSLASPKLPAPSEPAIPTVTEPAAPPPSEEAAPAPAPKPGLRHGADGAPARPRVASKAVRKPAAVPPPPSEAIETPSRDDLLHGLDRIRSNVQACAEGRNGVAEVDLTIAANGIVTNALVGGDFGGTPQGSCIARAVRKARFPTFKQDRYRVLFPYVL